jgi:hypothetical protein
MSFHTLKHSLSGISADHPEAERRWSISEASNSRPPSIIRLRGHHFSHTRHWRLQNHQVGGSGEFSPCSSSDSGSVAALLCFLNDLSSSMFQTLGPKPIAEKFTLADYIRIPSREQWDRICGRREQEGCLGNVEC